MLLSFFPIHPSFTDYTFMLAKEGPSKVDNFPLFCTGETTLKAKNYHCFTNAIVLTSFTVRVSSLREANAGFSQMLKYPYLIHAFFLVLLTQQSFNGNMA